MPLPPYLDFLEDHGNLVAKSELWVSVHKEVPSPWTITSFPFSIRSTVVHPTLDGYDRSCRMCGMDEQS